MATTAPKQRQSAALPHGESGLSMTLLKDPADLFPDGVDPDEHLGLLVETGLSWLTEADDIEQVREFRAWSSGMVGYLRDKVSRSEKAIQRAMELHLWADRRLGELLARQARNRGGRPRKTPVRGAEVYKPATLAEWRITENESRRSQRLAAIPLDRFVQSLEHHREVGDLSLSAVLKDSRQARSREPGAEIDDRSRLIRYLKASARGGDEDEWAQAHAGLLVSDDPHGLVGWLTVEEVQRHRVRAAAHTSIADAIELAMKNAEHRALGRLQPFFPSAAALAMATEDIDALVTTPDGEARPAVT